ncbi:ATP-dependent helicase [Romboutsia hominis]|nr:ATP-dependent helicase [Romboutsia hominis]MCH1968321.1 ATP-dependent helicase [Romboutsia hominis]
MISIDKLNENQKVAVEHVDGPCMVLAGPGSGKTRVITYRIANMVVNKGISPRSILAISFTKASSVEMKNRALSLSNDHRMNKVTYGTFHSVFFRILRYFEKYSLDNIFDEKSKRLLLKGILKSLNIENADDDETIGQVINEISYVKNELMDIRDFTSELLTSDEFLKAYNLYEEHKNQHNKIDFDDMLIKTYHLLKHNKSALDMVRGIYRYILVDEFQDINKVQFEVLKLIANPNNNIFVVGDEDQSIYGFRGARPDFLLEFEQYFKGTKKVLLDINYRSKDEIINIANRLIEKNENRYEKVIKCHQGEGGNVKYISPNDSEEEAVFIAKDILEEMKKDYVEYTDFAVIYRTNIQSRALVDVFMDMRIPFIVKDSIITIYDHWAAQDILAYLRIGVNPDSNKDWVRIINKPFRYISKEHVNMVKDEKNFINALINKCNLHPKQVKTINDLDIDLSYLKTLNPKMQFLI